MRLLRHIERLLTVLGHLEPERLLAISLSAARGDDAGLRRITSSHWQCASHTGHLTVVRLLLILAHSCLLSSSRCMRRRRLRVDVVQRLVHNLLPLILGLEGALVDLLANGQ